MVPPLSSLTAETMPVVAAAPTADDMAGFGELYERHRDRVFSLCLRMTGNVADAGDLTQDDLAP
jgi:RNA polymerase sigma-70 factor (ECF subfamily)